MFIIHIGYTIKVLCLVLYILLLCIILKPKKQHIKYVKAIGYLTKS